MCMCAYVFVKFKVLKCTYGECTLKNYIHDKQIQKEFI